MNFKLLGKHRGFNFGVGSGLSFDEIREREAKARKYSHFEPTLELLNQAEDPEIAWAEFVSGVHEGIAKAVS